MREVVAIGVGFHKFGRFAVDYPYTELGRVAIKQALQDAGVEWRQIQATFAGSAQQGMGAGHNVCSELGEIGIPIVNTEQACGSGTGAMRLAYHAVGAGAYDLACVVGFEKLGRGTPDATNYPLWARTLGLGIYPGEHAMECQRYIHEYGATVRQLASVSVVSHNHGALNPNAHYQMTCTIDDVLNSRLIADPITLYMAAPADEGGACVILCAKEVAAKYSRRKPITIAGSQHSTNIYDPNRAHWTMGTCFEEYKLAGRRAFEQAGVGPEDVDLVQAVDSFCILELQAIEALGFCPRGEAGRFVEAGATSLGGVLPVNTDGGYIARGNAFGAAGLASIAETVIQLRGEAGARQVHGAKVGLCHSAGAGLNAFVTILKS